MFCLKQTIGVRKYFYITSYNCSRNFTLLNETNNKNNNNTIIYKYSKNNYKSAKKSNTATLLLLTHQRSFSINETIINFWKTISNSTPVAYVQDGLVKIHDFTGLPWWATIILSTFLFRTTLILPLAIYQNIITARIENLTLEMPAIVSELKKETAIAMKAYQWTEQQARYTYNRSLKKQWNNLIVRDNCHPAKTIIVLWCQVPLWVFQSVALRNLVSMLPDPSKLEAQIIYTELTLGGFGWIPNLTEVDSSLIFPITLGLLNLSIIQLQTLVRTKPATKLQKYATNFFRILAIGMVPIAANVPSCLCFYWVISSTYGLVQNIVLLSPNVKRFLGIPKTHTEIPNPYQHIITSLREKKTQLISSRVEPPSSSTPPQSSRKQ